MATSIADIVITPYVMERIIDIHFSIAITQDISSALDSLPSKYLGLSSHKSNLENGYSLMFTPVWDTRELVKDIHSLLLDIDSSLRIISK